MRKTLKLKEGIHWNNTFVKDDWEACDLMYCHVKPSKLLAYLQENRKDDCELCYFTIVRNTYERLVSSWMFLQQMYIATEIHPRTRRVIKRVPAFEICTFDEFIRNIGKHCDALQTLPFSWMYLPFEKYFEMDAQILDKLHVFDLSRLDDVGKFLKEYGFYLETKKIVNSTRHNHYSTYYNEELRKIVETVYAYEIKRFKYEFIEEWENE